MSPFHLFDLSITLLSLQTVGIYDMGASIFHGVVIVVNYKLFLLSQKWTARQMVASTISILLVFVLHILWEKSPLRMLPIPFSTIDYSYLISSGSFLLSLLVLPQLALLPDAISQVINGIYKGLAGPGYSEKQNIK